MNQVCIGYKRCHVPFEKLDLFNVAGAVISLGGCNDQTVHSDTAHLFTCGHDLPPHYMNLFLISPDNAVSQSSTGENSCLCCDFRCVTCGVFLFFACAIHVAISPFSAIISDINCFV